MGGKKVINRLFLGHFLVFLARFGHFSLSGNELMDIGILGILDLVDRPDLDNAAVIEHRNAVGHLEGAHHVVRHHHGGHAEFALHIENEVVDDVARDGVQTRRRFIVKEDFGIEGDGAGQGDALAHTAGKFGRHLGAELGDEVDHLQLLGHHVLDLLFGKFRMVFTEGERDVLAGAPSGHCRQAAP